jgi:hypothetical protein
MILKIHRGELDLLADLLCEKETVDGSQIDVILGKVDDQVPLGVFYDQQILLFPKRGIFFRFHSHII